MGKVRRKDAKQEEERKARKAALKARKDKIREEPLLKRELGVEKPPKKILIKIQNLHISSILDFLILS